MLALLVLSLLQTPDLEKTVRDWTAAYDKDDDKGMDAAFKILRDAGPAGREALDRLNREYMNLNEELNEDRRPVREECERLKKNGELTEEKIKELKEKDAPFVARSHALHDEFLRRRQLHLELRVRPRLEKGEVCLTGTEEAARSIEHFGAKGDWATAAKCLVSGKEADAKTLYEKMTAARQKAGKPVQWAQIAMGRDSKWFCAVVLMPRHRRDRTPGACGTWNEDKQCYDYSKADAFALVSTTRPGEMEPVLLKEAIDGLLLKPTE